MSQNSILLNILTVVLLAWMASCANPDPIPEYKGKMCAFVDMNYDTFTDIVVQTSLNTVSILLAPADTLKNEATFSQHTDWNITVPDKEIIGCATGDVDGDSFVDIILTFGDTKHDVKMPAGMAVFFGSKANDFKQSFTLESPILNFASILDFNLDNRADILVQTGNDVFSCFASSTGQKTLTQLPAADCLPLANSPLKDLNYTIDRTFAHAYTYLDDPQSLAPNLLIGYKNSTNRTIVEWRNEKGKWLANDRLIQLPPPSAGQVTSQSQSLLNSAVSSIRNAFLGTDNGLLGLMAVADFDADGVTDLMIPEALPGQLVLHIWHWNTHNANRQWARVIVPLTKDESSVLDVQRNEFGSFTLGVGDADSDGYPDLLVLLVANKIPISVVIANTKCEEDGCKMLNNRKFVIDWERMKDVQKSDKLQIQHVAFFDMFEDGVLDYLVQTQTQADKALSQLQLHTALDARDTTFVKAQVYTSTCAFHCENGHDEGSVISRAGATVHYKVETEDGAMKGVHSQHSQQSYGIMQLPFVLFGLGRNPNFVELLRVTVPHAQQPVSHDWPQIVPNSRMYIVPPTKEGNDWIGRLYVTPSRLVLLSFATLCALCGCVLLIIVFLWWRERVHDHREREAQSHKFNFAM